MNNLNTVLIEGTLTRDPERRQMTTDVTYCRLAVANNRYYADRTGTWKQETSFFTIHVYGNVAETCMKYLRKGRGIRVVGRLKQYRFQNDGMAREMVYVIAEHIEFQPDKKAPPREENIEPKKIPGELSTTANLDGLTPPTEMVPEVEKEPIVENENVIVNLEGEETEETVLDANEEQPEEETDQEF